MVKKIYNQLPLTQFKVSEIDLPSVNYNIIDSVKLDIIYKNNNFIFDIFKNKDPKRQEIIKSFSLYKIMNIDNGIASGTISIINILKYLKYVEVIY